MAPPETFDLSRDDPRAATAAALAALQRGELVVVPTETVYGVAAREDRPDAVARLGELKAGRSRPFSLAVSSLEMLSARLAPLPPSAGRVMQRWWPGPVTLVLELKAGGTVGVRVPGHPWTRELVAAAGVPLLLPSANLPDEPAPLDAHALTGSVRRQVAVIVDAGRAALGEASTVVQPLRAGFRVLREGVVTRADLLRHAQPQVLVVCTGNTCRSPMAERLLAQALERQVSADAALVPPRVRSAGLAAAPGAAATRLAQEALADLDLDLSDHIARPLDREVLTHADLVLCMTAGQRAALTATLADSPGPRVSGFDPAGGDIEDPFGGSAAEYRAVARRLQHLAAQWAAYLLSPESQP